MQIIRTRCHARAALAGNPSDGYHGKTLSVLVRQFHADVVLYEWDRVEIVPCDEDHSRFDSIGDLARDVRLHGYYGGIRLVKATIKRFHGYCQRQGLRLHDRAFSIRYQSNVPRQVGLAGSTAIIVATLRALMAFYGVAIPLEVQPSLALAVETDELRIAAGLQDRVIEVYEGLVYMDFSREKMAEKHGYWHGAYERLDPALLPPLYVAYRADAGEPTEVFHNDIRSRFDRGDADVVEAMRTCAGLAEAARGALMARDAAALGALMDRNFDVRRSIYRLPAEQVEMVEVARKAGASANFAGSGGATIGVCRDDAMFAGLERDLGAIGCKVFRLQR
jgi:glucuronokinase